MLDPDLWRALIVLVFIWLAVVAAGLWVLEKLFPRIRRSDEPPPGVPPLPPVIVPPRPRPRRRLLAAPPEWLPRYWRATLALVIPLLLAWAVSVYLPVWFAPLLNQVTILTGFPLGYYMASQGALVAFLLLTWFYAWRMERLDREFGIVEPANPETASTRRVLVRTYAAFVVGLLGFTLLMAVLELEAGISPDVISWLFLFLTMAIYAVIGLRMRAHNLDDYYVAGRRVPGLFNGIATGSDWMSAASFISLAGTLYAIGYDGLAYISGWTGGYVLLAVLLAPYLRKFGEYTIADFVGARYPGTTPRVTAAVATVIISFTYVTAQVSGMGIIMSRFLGLNYYAGVLVGLAAVLFCSFLGGMRAVTWTQVAQGIIMLTAYLVPVTIITIQFTGVPFPQLMYGEALDRIVTLEAQLGLTRGYVEPFNDMSPVDFVALTLCLMLGTAGLPHILVRFSTAPTVREARSSVSWALVWIAVLYFTAPAYAAFSRLEILQNVVGQPVAVLPDWTTTWARTGLLQIADVPRLGGNGDGILQYGELRLSADLVVLAMPEIAGLPQTVAALVAAGGLAAALSTADGLLMVIAAAVAHDVYYRTVNPAATPRARLLIGRLMVLVAAALAAIVATQRLGIIVQLVAWAFSLAAASFFPVLVLGIFWKRANSYGAVAGMVAGLSVTAAYMIASYLNPTLSLFGIDTVAAGIFGFPVNILVIWLVSRATPPPPPDVQAMVDHLRHP